MSDRLKLFHLLLKVFAVIGYNGFQLVENGVGIGGDDAVIGFG